MMVLNKSPTSADLEHVPYFQLNDRKK